MEEVTRQSKEKITYKLIYSEFSTTNKIKDLEYIINYIEKKVLDIGVVIFNPRNARCEDFDKMSDEAVEACVN